MSLIEFGYDAGTFLRWAKNGCKGDMHDYKEEEYHNKKKFFSYNTRTTFLGASVYCFILFSDLYVFGSLYVTVAFFFLVYGVTFIHWYKRKQKNKKKKNKI